MQLPASPGRGPLSVVMAVPSPLLAEGPRCGSPPLLAGVRWWWWCVVPRHSGLRVLVAVHSHSWLGSAGRGGGGGSFPWAWLVGGFLCCVCLWRAGVRVARALCDLCVCGVCVGGGLGGVVWVCLPRVLVCVCGCVWCVGGLWFLVLASLGWACCWCLCGCGWCVLWLVPR